MSDLLSILGIVISTVGVIISLFFFNASIDNSRKNLLNRALYFIKFDHEIMSLFSSATVNNCNAHYDIKVGNIKKFNNSMFMLEEMLKEISYENDFGIPIIGESDEQISEDSFKHTYFLDEAYKNMGEYFNKRNLPNFYLMLNYWDDRCYFCQNYTPIYKYKRKFLIGPIYGVSFVFKRKNKTANYGNKKTELIKYVRNEKDFQKYYTDCYLNMGLPDHHKQDSCEREIKNLEITKDKENRIPITIYR